MALEIPSRPRLPLLHLPLTLGLLAAASSASAAERTVLVVDPPSLTEPRYSQAIAVTIHLTRETAGTPVPGTDCVPACSVIVDVGPPGDPAASAIVNAQGFVTDTNGVATARVAFVDGLYADDSVFPATPEGTPYTIRARFLGTGAGQVPANPDCVAAAPEDANGDLCPAEASVDVALLVETAEIAPGEGLVGSLGDDVVLSAELSDPNGDATAGGTDVDGPGRVVLAGRAVSFFYDVDNDGNAELSEKLDGNPDTPELDPVLTNDFGVASMTFTLDPQFIRAGTYDSGLHAEFAGDGRYGVARSSSRIVVNPADVDVSRTVVSADPPEIPADGFSKSVITVTLVDEFNNPLDETSDDHVILLSTDNGLLVDAVERDPFTGVYQQSLQAGRKDGPATVSVLVDGEPGPTVTVDIQGEGCRCTASSPASLTLSAAGLAVLALLHRRRR